MKEYENKSIAAKMRLVKQAPPMTADRILERLSSLKDNSLKDNRLKDNREFFAREKDTDHIWQQDVVALEAAISIISTLQDEGVSDEEALKDLVFDYNLANKQNKEYHRKFDTAARATPKDGVWHCPECNHRVAPGHSHCHWCGKKLGGW